MKKLITVITLFALVLSGCAGTTPKTPEGGADSALELEYKLGELVWLDSQTSIEMNSRGTRSERGLYIMENTSGQYPAYVRLDCVDMVSEAKAPICHLEGCAHDSTDCDAFMPRYGSTPWEVFSYGDMMFIFYTGAWYDYADPQTAIRPAGIDIARADGAGRRPLISYEAKITPSGYEDITVADDVGSLSIRGGVYCDGRYLYYTLREIASINYVPREQITGMNVTSYEFLNYLVTLDLATGEEISRVPYEDTVGLSDTILGVYRGKPLYYGVKLDENGDFIQSADGRQYTLSYFTLDFATGEARQVLEQDMNMDDPNLSFISFAGGELYRKSGGDSALYLFDPDTQQFTKAFDAPDDWDAYSLRIRDGRYLFYATLKDGTGGFYVTDALDEPVEKANLLPPLPRSGGVELMVCGESETDFLVISDMVEQEIPTVSANGEPITELRQSVVLSLISKEDYWNGVPNFREISGDNLDVGYIYIEE